MKFRIYVAAILLGALMFFALNVIITSIPVFKGLTKEPSTMMLLTFYSVIMVGLNAEMWLQCEYHIGRGDTSIAKLFFKTLFWYVVLYAAFGALIPYLIKLGSTAHDSQSGFYFSMGALVAEAFAVFGTPFLVRFIITTPMRDRAVRSHFKSSGIKPSVPKLPTGGGPKKRRD